MLSSGGQTWHAEAFHSSSDNSDVLTCTCALLYVVSVGGTPLSQRMQKKENLTLFTNPKIFFDTQVFLNFKTKKKQQNNACFSLSA